MNMIRRGGSACLLASALLLIAAPFRAQADKIATIDGFVSGGFPGFHQSVEQTADISITGSSPGPMDTTSASAAVTWGSIKVFGAGSPGSSTNQMGAFTDFVTFNVPSLPMGTLIQVTESFSAAGSLSIDAGCSGCEATWGGELSLGGSVFDVSGDLLPGGFSGNPIGGYSHIFTAAVGTQTTLGLKLTGLAKGNQGTPLPPGSASDDLAHSMYWAGISSVTVNGQPVGSFSVTSQSGTDWTQSFVPTGGSTAPEPATTLLTFLPLAGLLLIRRRAAR